MIWTLAFWKGAAERAIKTFFQSLIAVFGVTATGLGESVGLTEVDWLAALSVAALAALISLFTSISNADFTAGTNAIEVAKSQAAAEAAAKVVAAAEAAAAEAAPQRAIGFAHVD